LQTGTDEHGLKMAQKARELGMTPRALADEMAGHFIAMCQALKIDYDVFMRTTEPRHHTASQELWRRMAAKRRSLSRSLRRLVFGARRSLLRRKAS